MLVPNFRARGQFFPPGIPRIKSGHPLAEGLRFYAYDLGNSCYVDLISGQIAQNRAPEYGALPTKVGTFTPLGGSGNAYFFPCPEMYASAGGMSWACGYIQTANVVSFCRPFGRTAKNGASAPFVNWDFEINPNNTGQSQVNSNFASNNGGLLFKTIAASGNNTQNAYHSGLSSVDPTGTSRFYFDGALVGSSTGFSYIESGTLASADSMIFISGASPASGGNAFIGYVPYGAWWDRVLSDDEAKLLHWDPTCFLEYPEDEVFATVVGAAAAPSSFNPVWARNANVYLGGRIAA